MAQAANLSADNLTWISAFEARDDLSQFGDNAIGLFALALKFGVEDLQTVAANSITDGSDDKSCDILFVDRENQRAVVAQCYFSKKEKASAPANKAHNLNAALGWILGRHGEDLPKTLRSAATELQSAIREGDIKTLHLWYIHNLPESKNVENELKTAESSARHLISGNFEETNVEIRGLEVGTIQLEEWYSETQSPILVSETFDIDVKSGFRVDAPEWSAYVCAIPARFLHTAYKKHRVRLFSANVRDYLGSRDSDSNINNGIKKTAEGDPQNFWAFNNGLTILVYKFDEPKQAGEKLRVTGASIVNGAQTTGALASLKKMPAKECMVPARFVQTKNQDVVQQIIRYNNSQNKVTASDFRSTDSIQKRLRDEFQQLTSAEYEGGRRGGAGDAIRRRPNLLPSYTVGQALAAFHGDPVVGYNMKSDIWNNDSLYSKYFNEHTTARHIVFCYSLLKAVEEKKITLLTRSKNNESLTEAEEVQLSIFRKRGSNYVLASAIAACIETFIGRRVPNRWRLSFGDSVSPRKAQDHWASIVEVSSPFLKQLEDCFSDGLKNAEKVKQGIQNFSSLVEATKTSNAPRYKAFGKLVIDR